MRLEAVTNTNKLSVSLRQEDSALVSDYSGCKESGHPSVRSSFLLLPFFSESNITQKRSRPNSKLFSPRDASLHTSFDEFCVRQSAAVRYDSPAEPYFASTMKTSVRQSPLPRVLAPAATGKVSDVLHPG